MTTTVSWTRSPNTTRLMLPWHKPTATVCWQRQSVADEAAVFDPSTILAPVERGLEQDRDFAQRCREWLSPG